MFGSEPLSHVTFYNINIGMIDDALVFLTHTIEYFYHDNFPDTLVNQKLL